MSLPLSELTKKQLMALARHHQVVRRSRMTKQELVTALEQATSEPEHGKDHDVATRRQILATRLDSFIDHSKSCNWRSVEGHACGLPAVRDHHRCTLHGGIDNTHLAIPATGRLGFDTWPTLLRHIWLASYDIDPIGLDPVIADMTWHLANYLYFEYFRVVVEGVENIPQEGGTLLAANHGGAALPYDAMMLTMAVTNEMAVPRRPRIMATEVFNATPTLSHLYRKVGGVYASRADASYLLEEGHLVGVFPEGVRAFQKPFSQAYQVQRFGRGGFLTMAERYGAPVVPVAIVGSDEVHPALFSSQVLARFVRMIWPSQRVEEMAVYLNLVPLPIRWRVRFLEPIMPSHAGTDPDPLEMLEKSELIRNRIQHNLDAMLVERGSAI
ncbi:MAG: 1-acyl-sn-glycerol-3-phosphate acyltransferase [Acidimicrobiia bacterium]|nr:1-acyl-sn-glycerol-3-phosphate acyltransferase [Acidimicrobiia bacterium]MDX2466503.1 1-acyl-sn-glycerol-3-phosphate acyltransferase [Acidimicrobiia bacterium]